MANGKKAALAAIKGFGVFVGYFIVQNLVAIPAQYMAGRELANANPGRKLSLEEINQNGMEFTARNAVWFIVIAAAITLLIMFITSLIRKKRFSEMTGMEKTSPKNSLAGAMIGLGFAPVVLTVLSLLPGSVMQNYAQSASVLGGGTLVGTILGAVIAAPVIEEIICRGLIFRGMRKHTSFLPSVIVSSIIFALAHSLSGFSIVWITYTFVLGVVLAIVCEKTGSIIPSIFLHIGFNIFGTVISGLIAPYMSTALTIIVAVAGVALIAAGFFLLRKKNAVSNAIKFETAD